FLTQNPLRFSPPTGARHAPSLFLFPPPPEELSGPSPTLSLTCLARGFSPEPLDLQWHRRSTSASGAPSDVTSSATA
ncbi:IGHM protein, partial [Sitta europaea]|nr:IGHM protein [Sitta europaea]